MNERYAEEDGGLDWAVPAFSEWLAEVREPFFAFLHSYDAHAPYDPPPPWERYFDPDYAVAADGTIVKGQGTFNQANITGESLPVDKKEGEDVFAGTINLTGVLEIKVSRAGQDTSRARDPLLQITRKLLRGSDDDLARTALAALEKRYGAERSR